MAKIFSVSDFSKHALDKDFRGMLAKLYGDDEELIRSQQERYIRLSELYRNKYPENKEFRIFSAPGRTEIAGNHTDHQGGHVLCASVDMDVIAFAYPNEDNVIRIQSEYHDDFDQIDLSDLKPAPSETGRSAALIRGVAAGFVSKGLNIGGFDAYTTSRIPKGSGLSSSAAFEILICTVLNHMYNKGNVSSLTMAKISQGAENVFFGKPSGLMDQCGCAFGGMMTIDFKDKDNTIVKPLDIEFGRFGHHLVITDTRGDHSDLTGDYAQITKDMRKAAGFFGKAILSEVERDKFTKAIPELYKSIGIGSVLRAMHFFQDDQRVSAQADALEKSDFTEFLRLVNESGISSWTLLRNIYSASHPENMQVALALAVTAEYLERKGACRVHGGGFAGTIQAFVPTEMVSGYISRMESLFGKGCSKQIQIRSCPATELK